ncbi:LacI family DNA-binding transcriptional regulator [Bacillus sp. JJ1533]|uniref:LacI family DNA-binding transcriptional regulator n=1 Tax=Bacillus sp. JJ1533 TaxID=3122959 RepID=UPI002FFFEB83
MKKVTVNDVAKKAGVSQTTVSRVLNNFPQMKESTRQKVLKAINELGYSPNEIARSMVNKKTRTIGLIVGDISNPFYAEVAKVIMAEARKRGYDVIITDTDYDNDIFENNVRTLTSKQVDGILIATIHHEDTIVNQLNNTGFPIVYLNRIPEREDMHFVCLDDEKGSSIAVEHLIDLGHTNIAVTTYPSRFATYYKRHLAFKNALIKYGNEENKLNIYDGEFSYENIYNFVKQVLSSEKKPTAFVTTTDQQAISVMDSVSKLGYSVPGDISVVGFGDIGIASHPYINLTTISAQKEEMGRMALNSLIEIIESKSNRVSPVQVMLEPKLIKRKTTSFLCNEKAKEGLGIFG